MPHYPLLSLGDIAQKMGFYDLREAYNVDVQTYENTLAKKFFDSDRNRIVFEYPNVKANTSGYEQAIKSCRGQRTFEFDDRSSFLKISMPVRTFERLFNNRLQYAITNPVNVVTYFMPGLNGEGALTEAVVEPHTRSISFVYEQIQSEDTIRKVMKGIAERLPHHLPKKAVTYGLSGDCLAITMPVAVYEEIYGQKVPLPEREIAKR